MLAAACCRYIDDGGGAGTGCSAPELDPLGVLRITGDVRFATDCIGNEAGPPLDKCCWDCMRMYCCGCGHVCNVAGCKVSAPIAQGKGTAVPVAGCSG